MKKTLFFILCTFLAILVYFGVVSSPTEAALPECANQFFCVDPGTDQGLGGGTNANTPGRSGNFLGIPIRDLGGNKGLLTILLQTSLIFAGIGFFIYLIFGGIKWLTSGGDKTAMQSARDTLTQAFTGLIIIIAVYGIIVILENLFGLSILSRGIKFPTPVTP